MGEYKIGVYHRHNSPYFGGLGLLCVVWYLVLGILDHGSCAICVKVPQTVSSQPGRYFRVEVVSVHLDMC